MSCWRQLLFVALIHWATCTVAYAQLSQLLTKVPRQSNALVVVHAKNVLSSPMARSAGWADGHLQAGRSGMISLPENVEWFVMAAELDFEYMQPIWEVAAAYMPQRPQMSAVAERSEGRLDRLAGSEAVERPNDSYVVAFGPRMIGAASPANRQQVIRWVRESKVKKTPDLSQYLAGASEVVEDGSAQMVLAFDLNDLLAPEEITEKLTDSQTLAGNSLTPAEAGSILASLEGARIELVFKQNPHAHLRLTFDQDPTPIKNVASPLLGELLAKQGVHLDELSKWEIAVEDRDLVFTGQLSDSGLRRVLTILSGPVGPWEKSTGDSYSAENAMAEVSRQYFQAVTGYLNDLFVDNVTQPQSLHQVEVWVERYARKIEDLDTYGVDPDVLRFAENVVIRLDEISSTLARAERRGDIREATLWNSGRSRYGRYGTYGYFEKGYVTRDRQLARADENIRGVRDSQAIVNELHALSDETRAEMTKRYDIQF